MIDFSAYLGFYDLISSMVFFKKNNFDTKISYLSHVKPLSDIFNQQRNREKTRKKAKIKGPSLSPI